MGLILKASLPFSASLTWNQTDNNFLYLLSNMSGSNTITGNTTLTGSLTITSGSVIGTASYANTASYVSTASYANNINFPTWSSSNISITFTGANLWQSNIFSGQIPLQYLVNGKVIFLSGTAHNSGSSSPTTASIATLPASIAPSYNIQLLVYSATGGGVVPLNISSSGLMYITATGGGAGRGGDTIYFEGLHYKLGS
jgi:hypothetical protein